MTTNKHGLPESFVTYNKSRNAAYSKGKADISATQLLDSPQIRILRKVHEDDPELEGDIVDSIWQMFGTAVHKVLEESSEGDLTEERLFMDVNGWTLSGAIDNQRISGKKCLVTDYKVTSVWSVIYDIKKEWIRQGNIYAHLIETNKDMKVVQVQICAILRDWSRREATYKPDYPQAPVVIIKLPLWTFDERQKYIEERVEKHQKAQSDYEKDKTLTTCSAEDRWARPEKYAVTKKGNKRATKVFDTKAEANKFMLDKAMLSTHQIITRKGEHTRCEGNYCQVSKRCPFWKNIIVQRTLDEITGADSNDY